jgi:hypothetical protein
VTVPAHPATGIAHEIAHLGRLGFEERLALRASRYGGAQPGPRPGR